MQTESGPSYTELAVEVARLSEGFRSCKRRIEKLEDITDTLSDLATSVAVLAESQKNMVGEQLKMTERLDSLDAVPKSRWNSIIDTIVTTVVNVLITALVTGAIVATMVSTNEKEGGTTNEYTEQSKYSCPVEESVVLGRYRVGGTGLSES